MGGFVQHLMIFKGSSFTSFRVSFWSSRKSSIRLPRSSQGLCGQIPFVSNGCPRGSPSLTVLLAPPTGWALHRHVPTLPLRCRGAKLMAVRHQVHVAARLAETLNDRGAGGGTGSPAPGREAVTHLNRTSRALSGRRNPRDEVEARFQLTAINPSTAAASPNAAEGLAKSCSRSRNNSLSLPP